MTKLTKSLWELTFQPESSGSAKSGSLLMQEADVFPLSLNSCPRKCKWEPKSDVQAHLLRFASDYCFSKLNFQSPVRNILSRMQQRVWRQGVEEAVGARLAMKTLHFFPHPQFLSLTLHRGKVGRGALLPNHSPCSTAEAKKQTIWKAVFSLGLDKFIHWTVIPWVTVPSA